MAKFTSKNAKNKLFSLKPINKSSTYFSHFEKKNQMVASFNVKNRLPKELGEISKNRKQ